MKRNSRIEDSGERMTSFVLDAQTLNQFKSIITREGKSMKVMIEDYMKDYNKIHAEGNPQHTIDSFSENEDFKGFPSIAIDKKKKEKWIGLPQNKDEINNLFWHVQEYMTILKKKGFEF